MSQIKDLEQGIALPIMEDFYSVQGEAFHTGTPSYFIRIGGCDVGCHWCDVKESWNAALHPVTPVREVIDRMPEHTKTVIITGGEPLEYNLNLLTKLIREKGIQTHLETSGTHPVSGQWDWICLSPKKFKPPVLSLYPLADELKIIVRNKSDFAFAEKEAEKVSPYTRHLFLQPEWSVHETITPVIIEYIKRNPHWKLSVQLHKFLKIP